MRADDPFAILAFDHRGDSFRSVLPSTFTEPITPESVREAKSLIYEAYLAALDRGVGEVRPGVLVDEEYGAAVARRARELGALLIMPVERADGAPFDFAYGDEFAQHIHSFAPDYAKALVRFNSDDPADVKALQLSRLRLLSDRLAPQDVGFMFELIVPPHAQSARTPGFDRVRYEDVDRPLAVCKAIAEIQDAGICVDIWKLEGIATPEHALAVSQQAMASDWPAQCVILGAAADGKRVTQWLNVAAATEGFVGFAIGRSIWGPAVRDWLGGIAPRDEVIERIADTYVTCSRQYLSFDHS